MAEFRKAALRAGVSHTEFWSLTPYETFLSIEAGNEREIGAYKVALFGAWHTVSFDRTKRLPPLDRTLARLDGGRRRRSKRRLKPEEAKSFLEQMNTAFGGIDNRKKDGALG